MKQVCLGTILALAGGLLSVAPAASQISPTVSDGPPPPNLVPPPGFSPPTGTPPTPPTVQKPPAITIRRFSTRQFTRECPEQQQVTNLLDQAQEYLEQNTRYRDELRQYKGQ